VAGLLSTAINLYVYAIIGRIILSYFPIRPGSVIAPIFSFLYTITEPVLGPARRIIPAVGMLDFSPIVVIFGLYIIGGAVVNALPG
jgi:YggT family protein